MSEMKEFGSYGEATSFYKLAKRRGLQPSQPEYAGYKIEGAKQYRLWILDQSELEDAAREGRRKKYENVKESAQEAETEEFVEAVTVEAGKRGRERGTYEGEETFPTEGSAERVRTRKEASTRKEFMEGADPVTRTVYKKVARVDEYGRKIPPKPKKKAVSRGRVLYDSSGRRIVLTGAPSRSSGWSSDLKQTGKFGKKKDTKALRGIKSFGRRFGGTPRTKMSMMPGTPKIAQTGKGMPRIADMGSGMSRSRPAISRDIDLSSMRWPPENK